MMLGQRFERSLQVARESYEVLRSNPALAIFPVLSGIATVIVSIPFLTILALTSFHRGGQSQQVLGGVHYAASAAFYFCNYFVIIFFNSALVACASESLQGRKTDVGYGIHAAIQRLPQILGWTLIASTVGMVLRIISERTGIVGSILSAIAGLVWSVAVYFVIPCLILDRVGPITAVKSSAGMIKRTWGERVILGIGIGTVLFLFGLIALIPFVIGVAFLVASMWIAAGLALIAAVILFLAVAVVGSAITTIYQTALYIYSRNGAIPSGFQPSSLQGAFAPKAQRRGF